MGPKLPVEKSITDAECTIKQRRTSQTKKDDVRGCITRITLNTYSSSPENIAQETKSCFARKETFLTQSSSSEKKNCRPTGGQRKCHRHHGEGRIWPQKKGPGRKQDYTHTRLRHNPTSRLEEESNTFFDKIYKQKLINYRGQEVFWTPRLHVISSNQSEMPILVCLD